MRAGADPPWVSVSAGSGPAVNRARPDGEGSSVGTVAFVFEGGGSLGAAQVGMLYALVEAGITPDLVVGTSVGAMNGALLASRADLRRSIGDLECMWRSIRRGDVLPVRPVDAFRAVVGRRAGLVPASGLARLVERWLPVTDLGDLTLPFAAIATDIDTGEAVPLRAGPARDALLASAAIPGVYAPVRLGGRTLVDGGLVANFPVDIAARLGATRIFALPTAVSAPARLRGPLALVQRASDVLVTRASRRALDATASTVVVEEVPAPVTSRSMFDFRGAGPLMDAGYRGTSRWLAGLPAHDHATPAEAAGTVPQRFALG
jgi:NTE family protein